MAVGSQAAETDRQGRHPRRYDSFGFKWESHPVKGGPEECDRRAERVGYTWGAEK